MKDITIQFNFLDKIYSAEVIPSFSEKPFYFFILFNENDIITEFGEEMSIATVDGNSIINNLATNTKVKSLKEVIFREIQKIPEYSTKLKN
jgi:hypothetical protein